MAEVKYSLLFNDPPAGIEAIVRVSLWRYRIPFTRPLPLATETLSHRDGLLLRWQTSNQQYWTEAAPLAGFSSDTPAQCETALAACFQAASSLQTLWQPDVLNRLPPPARLALESLSLAMMGNTAPAPPLVQLLLSEPDNPVADYPAVKLKVGRRSIEDDVKRTQQVIARLSEGQRLRLDANRSWFVADTVQFFAGLNDAELAVIDWIEEPLANPGDYRYWAVRIPVSFALDECLYQSAKLPDMMPGLAALILKPMLLGWQRTETLVRWAERHGCEWLLSGTFESSVAVSVYHHYLAHRNLSNRPQGLDTTRFLAQSICLPDMTNERQPTTNTEPVAVLWERA